MNTEQIRKKLFIGLALTILIASIIRFAIIFSDNSHQVADESFGNHSIPVTTDAGKKVLVQSTTFNQYCHLPEIQRGDGICEDFGNSMECGYDLGDCCLPYVLAFKCHDCFCHETQSQHILVFPHNFTSGNSSLVKSNE